MKDSTKAIHVGQQPDPTTGAVIPPLYLTSTYAQEAPGQHKGYEYTRSGNPNFTNAEQTLAALENGEFALIYSSGLGATTTIALSFLQSGDTVLAINDLYGGTYRLLKNVFEKFGVHFETIDTSDLENVEKNFSEKKPKLFIVESPTNPLLKISDIAALTGLARKYSVISVVDNTFVSPYFQKPLDLGADIVLHSTTKYLGGHSDVIGGATVTRDPEIQKKLAYHRNAAGMNPSPFDARLLSRSLKTLSIRMERHEYNAKIVAEFFSKHPLVKKVYYPGLENHPGHEIAKKQMSGFGGMISVEFTTDFETTMKLISSFKLITLAESLGGVESLVDHPASMTHGSIPKAEREKNGLSDGLVRFSIGIEDVSDLLEDLDNSLSRVTN